MRKTVLMVYILLLAIHLGRSTPSRLRETAAAFDRTYSSAINPELPRQLAKSLEASEPKVRTALLVNQHRPSNVVMAALVSRETKRDLAEVLGATNSYDGIESLASAGIKVAHAIETFERLAETLQPLPPPASGRPHATIATFGN